MLQSLAGVALHSELAQRRARPAGLFHDVRLGQMGEGANGRCSKLLVLTLAVRRSCSGDYYWASCDERRVKAAGRERQVGSDQAAER